MATSGPDFRKVRNVGEWAKEMGVRSLTLTPDGGISLEFFPDDDAASLAPAPSPEELAERAKRFSEKITYLSAGG